MMSTPPKIAVRVKFLSPSKIAPRRSHSTPPKNRGEVGTVKILAVKAHLTAQKNGGSVFGILLLFKALEFIVVPADNAADNKALCR